MIADLLALIDRFVEFAKVRKERRRSVFDKYVEPMYADAEQVYRDYLRLLRSVEEDLQEGVDLDVLLRRLEEGRLEYQPRRDKVRAVLRRREREIPELSRFERGVWGILRGGLSRYEETFDYDFSPYGHYSEHTLLDVLKRLRRIGPKASRRGALATIRSQLKYLKRAWQDVVEGYAELQTEVLREA